MGKIRFITNRPVDLGQVILYLSKIIMYKFHHDYMLPKYGECLKLCYMDTDSFVYDFKTDDFYKDIADDVNARFNVSGYCQNHPLAIGVNKQVIGLMKDELGGRIMTDFVGLRPKLYAFKTFSGSGDKKCRGS